MTTIAQWTVFEQSFDSKGTYDSPFWDVSLEIQFVAPSGQEHRIDAFWDGDRRWVFRFSPDETGTWRWRSVCSNPADAGLHDQTGTFTCEPYQGDNPLYRRGPLRVSDSGRYLAHADGTPFFWLADTAWNGVLLAEPDDWQTYLQARRQQRFTAVQFVSTQWRGSVADALGEVAFHGTEQIRLNPQFFQRLDPKVRAINENGLIAAPVLLWTLTATDPGQTLAEGDATRLVRYLVARWGAHQVVWFLGGDGHYEGALAARWQRIGRAVFADDHPRLVTMHPCGQSWVADEFWDEPWFDFIGYQSGHGDSREHLDWLVKGPPARDWDRQPPRPVINLEPNYETHRAYHSKSKFSDHEVRRAAYWSLLVSPPAGVTFGHNAIWVWATAPRLAEGHEALGIIGPWQEGLYTPGTRSMRILHEFFADLPWWDLRPAPDLLVEQPGASDPRFYVPAALTPDGKLAVFYQPFRSALRLNLESLPRPLTARWFDPRSGTWIDGGTLNAARAALATPSKREDWLLVLSQ